MSVDDINLLAIIGTVVCVGIAGGFSLMLLVLPRQPALWAWSISLWLTAAAVGMIYFIDDLSGSRLLPWFGLLALLGAILLLKGTALYTGKPLPIWKPLLVMGGFLLVTGLDVVWLQTGVMSTMAFSLATVVLNGWVALMLLRNTPPELRLSHRVAGTVFILLALTAVPGLFPMPEDAPAATVEQSDLVQLVMTCFNLMLAMAQCFALMLLLVQRMLVQLHERATRDGLTGLLNRASLINSGLKALADGDKPFAVLIVDLDHFKQVNDTWGHLSGDAVLRHFAAAAQEISATRPHMLGRYGGEEFVLMLPGAQAGDAMQVARQLVNAARDANVQVSAGILKYTVSVGVSHAASGATLEQLLAKADAALYRAKAAGRNRACGADALAEQEHAGSEAIASA